MDDFGIWWYIIAAVLYFLTTRKKKKQASSNPSKKNRPERSSQPKSFEDLLREITEGPQDSEEDSPETLEESGHTASPSPSRAAEKEKKAADIRNEGKVRHFADEESRKVYEDSIKMAEGADLDFQPSDNYREPRIFKGLEVEKVEDEWTIADDIRDGLSSNEAKKAIIYSEILNRKY